MYQTLFRFSFIFLTLFTCTVSAAAQPRSANLSFLKKIAGYNSVVPTLQVVVQPLLKRGSPIHDAVWKSLQDLGANYVRYVPWLSFPHLSVPELRPGVWDFSLVDPLALDFMNSSQGHPFVLNFSVIPQWMFVGGESVQAPADPDIPMWDYERGSKLQVSLSDLGDYYKRIFQWYTKGGFVDELGESHESGHFYEIPYWEVFNEIDGEHNMEPDDYVDRFNAVADSIRSVTPATRFVGLALSDSFQMDDYLDTFLDRGHLKDGDMISFHFYGEEPWKKLFKQADYFIGQAEHIAKEVFGRKNSSPKIGLMINELGTFSAREASAVDDPLYWNMSAAFYAYTVAKLASSGIQVIGESQLIGVPGQFPHVTMVNWETGAPNARFYVLKLLKDHLRRGDQIRDLRSSDSRIYARSFTRMHDCGERDEIVASVLDCPLLQEGRMESNIIVVNKSRQSVTVRIPGIADGTLEYLDSASPESPPVRGSLDDDTINLKPYEVAIVTLKP